jgi:hypothetical protein
MLRLPHRQRAEGLLAGPELKCIETVSEAPIFLIQPQPGVFPVSFSLAGMVLDGVDGDM